MIDFPIVYDKDMLDVPDFFHESIIIEVIISID